MGELLDVGTCDYFIISVLEAKRPKLTGFGKLAINGTILRNKAATCGTNLWPNIGTEFSGFPR